MMSLYTVHDNNNIDKDIEYDLEKIVSAVDNCLVYESIYLIGSFGRGEGSVRFDGNRWRGVNDYDLVIVTSKISPAISAVKSLGCELATQLNIDFVDLGCLDTESLTTLSPTLQHFDFKYGSRLLKGSELRDLIPDFSSSDIPAFEFVRLLCNRAAGILTSMLPEHDGSVPYRSNQIMKLCIAIGDVAVFMARGYHQSYRVRAAWFDGLASDNRLPFEMSESAIKYIRNAYLEKLHGPFPAPFTVDEELLHQLVRTAYCAMTSHIVGSSIIDMTLAEKALIMEFAGKVSFEKGIKILLSTVRNPSCNMFCSSSLRNRILFAQPVFSSGKGTGLTGYLRRFWFVPGGLGRSWNALSAVRLWEMYNH